MVFLRHELSVDEHLACGGLLEPIDAADERGLAGARRSDDHELLARLDGQVDILQHVKIAEVLIETADLVVFAMDEVLPFTIRAPGPKRASKRTAMRFEYALLYGCAPYHSPYTVSSQ